MKLISIDKVLVPWCFLWIRSSS